jgi:hypothetical protein
MRETLHPIGPGAIIYVSCLEPIIVSAATALHALSRRPTLLQTHSEIRDKSHKLLAELDYVFSLEKERICYLGAHPDDWTADGVLLSAVPALVSICRCIPILAEFEIFPLERDGNSLTLKSFVERLIDSLQAQPAYTEGVTALEQFRDAHLLENPSSVILGLSAGDNVLLDDDNRTQNSENKTRHSNTASVQSGHQTEIATQLHEVSLPNDSVYSIVT